MVAYYRCRHALPFILWQSLCSITLGWSALSRKPSTRFVGSNTPDAQYPWCFTGRAIYRPALVRLDDSSVPSGLFVFNVGGWTLGGYVALEYDESPVGPYREFVTLGGLACSVHSRKLMMGQYGTSLCVNKISAKRICEQIWEIPAELASIEFVAEGERPEITILETTPSKPNKRFRVQGWKNLQHRSSERNFRDLLLLWTPRIKSIWTQIFFGFTDTDMQKRPLHQLRLSGNAALLWSGWKQSSRSEVTLGIDLVIRNILIEISPSLKTSES